MTRTEHGVRPSYPVSMSAGRGIDQGRGNRAKAIAKIMGMPRDTLFGIVLGVSVLLNITLIWQASKTETEVRMLEFYVLELDAKLIAAGFKTDAESIAKRLREQEKRQ